MLFFRKVESSERFLILPRHYTWIRARHYQFSFLRDGEKISRRPEKSGTGVIEGVAGLEAANNAAASVACIPLLSLGIPAIPSAAILLGALMIQGLSAVFLLFAMLILISPLFTREKIGRKAIDMQAD